MMKKFIIFGIMCLLVSSCLCIEQRNNYKISNDDLLKYSKTLKTEINGVSVEIPLRCTINDAMKTKLVNTSDKEIKEYYLTKPIIYLEYNLSLSQKDGGVSIMDLVGKLIWLNNFYPHKMVIPINVSENITAKVILNNKEGYTTFTPSEIEMIKNSNKTMIIKVIKTNNNATITKIKNTFIIEGNSLYALDMAESRFIIAICNN
ncbi:hypothetical protein [Methanotorris igneus]|uniref:Lipoprotein n=1 Tax=Methanotorris igneus (strain DSM 5666 / JCM 11834 / Kol 5) TaxID=880724 RepID=F6BCF9_METIK|nr:hypothetical protein [Methanotorris igneus]AEF96170.1 hypothetical protein Metig_0620 [Methanotorris igneus Kol 5]